MRLALDTGLLGQLGHPRNPKNRPVADWLVALVDGSDDDDVVYLPEIADYELRRKLLHLIHKGQAERKSIDRLNQLGLLMEYLPIDTPTLRRAAELWAEARSKGQPTAAETSLDGDVILAAQAESVSATVVTNNPGHISRFVSAVEWSDLTND